LRKTEQGDPYFLIHFLNKHNLITNWMKFEKVFLKDSFFLSGITLIKSNYADTVDTKTSVGAARTVISSWEETNRS